MSGAQHDVEVAESPTKEYKDPPVRHVKTLEREIDKRWSDYRAQIRRS